MLKYFFIIKLLGHWKWSELFMSFSYESKQYLCVYRACVHDLFQFRQFFSWELEKLLLKLSSLCWNTFFIIEFNRLLKPWSKLFMLFLPEANTISICLSHPVADTYAIQYNFKL